LEASAPPPSNRRLQLTAFGARDRAFFDTFRSASAAAEAQDVGRAPSISSLIQKFALCSILMDVT
jgi:hypothetical protein